MDEIDKANERAEQFLVHSIACAAKGQALPIATGHCFNCSNGLALDERWCDSDCRNDWEARQHKRLRK